MIKSDFVARIAGFFVYYRWHPEVALRYLPIVDQIKKHSIKTILEVGSGGLGIAPYLKRKVTGVDTNFREPFHPLLKRVKGNAVKLPFKNNSFEAVISADMLEHLSVKYRGRAIDEIVRVAKKLVVIAVPCGHDAQMEDEDLDKHYKRLYKKRYHFFKEQVTYGLPKKDEVVKALNQSLAKKKVKASISVWGNETIALHHFLMLGWMNPNIISKVIFRKFLLFAIPLMRRLNSEPTYRKIFTVSIKNV